MQRSNQERYPLISIVILNQDGIAFLRETIPPLLDLSYPRYEIVVIDNGSKDESIEYLEKISCVTLIKNSGNRGYSKGKNQGVDCANGEYILFLDNDIKLRSKTVLSELIKEFKNDTGLIQLPLLDKDETDTYHYGLFFGIYGSSQRRLKVPLSRILGQTAYLVPIAAATGGALFFKKSTWIEIGGLDESQLFNIDDIDIGPRSWILGYKNFLYTKAYADHLGINKTVSAESYCYRYKTMFSGHARAMLKNYKFINLLYSFPLLLLFHFLKSLNFSLKKRTLKVFLSFLFSCKSFLRNLPSTIEQRKLIQSKRKVNKDIFLAIRSVI